MADLKGLRQTGRDAPGGLVGSGTLISPTRALAEGNGVNGQPQTMQKAIVSALLAVKL